MATIVVDALVSASVKLLLGKIDSGEFVDFFRSTKLDYALLKKLKPTLLGLQAVLIDAEQKQITNSAVKEWLLTLQDVVFEVEDLFDEINTEAFSSYKTINSKMEEVLINLKNFEKQVKNLGLVVGVSSTVWHGTATTSVAVDEYSIYGRANDKNKLKGFLLSDDARERDGKIGVVSIVGMGGLGKTTLAKQLFNDPEVIQKFNLKGWPHISKDFDVLGLTKALVESITGESSKANFLDTLQLELQKSLNGKKFLLVLDDIWVVNYVDWDSLLENIFNVGEAGSRIIITTRDERIAQTMRTFLPIHKLEPLEAEDCWFLLAKHAFGASNYQQRSNLEQIGREIAKKCDGLPLAAVALGGLLRTKLSPDNWNDVLRSNIWELENTMVKPALLLSYHYLPVHLKRCFAYCAIFPKNYKLDKEMIAQLWIAEGLVLQPKDEENWENVGKKYLDELVSRSMIQQQSVDGKEIFEMHDLMNDLATTISYPYCVRLDEQKVVKNLERVRHLSYYNPNADNSYNKFDRFHRLKGLRTFLSLPSQDRWSSEDCITNKAVRDLFLKMKHLHSLSLSSCSLMTKVPTSIGNLVYLRYLNLSGTDIVSLPSETCKLVNLQTLILSNCRRLFELPEDVGKLVSLRNLNVRGTLLKEMSLQLTKLKNLQTLSNFIVSKQCDGLKVGDLGKFPHLRGNLSISGLQNVIDPSDASQANLVMKKQIEELKLKWDHPSDSDSHIQSGVLERLRPSTNLKSLVIKGYGGTNFPNWLGDSSFGNMVYLKIKNCDNCSQLPPLGQLGKLKQLFIRGMKSVKSIGAEFYGKESGPSFQPFPSLETLSFEDMQEWEEWNLSTTTEFPLLRCLTLEECPKLKGNIPTNLPSLTKLRLLECPLLVEPWSSNDNSNMLSSEEEEKYYEIECTTPKELEFSFHNYPSLESLTMHYSCYSMTSFTLDTFPLLKDLRINGCEKLKTIVIVSQQQQSLSSLSVYNCDEVESISFVGIELGFSIPNLSYLWVHKCKKLGSLLEPMNTLVGLRSMYISNLPNLQSIGKDGFPINLRELTIESGDIVEAVMKMKVGLLPTSLETLMICDLGDIEHLDGKWLQHLTSLQQLWIVDAPNLKSLPDEGFPASLSSLVIYDCRLLEERLKDKKGKEWTNIAHIPTIEII